MRKLAWLLPMMLWMASELRAQGANSEGATLEFHLVRPGLPVPEYTLVFYEPDLDGVAGIYTAEVAPVAGRYSQVAGGTTETVERMHGGDELKEELFRLARTTQDLSACASRRRGIASTGAKTLSFKQGSKGSVVCRFDYTENTKVQELTRRMQAIAATLDFGRELERDERFNRLVLDPEITALTGEVKQGMAMGLIWIRPVLEELAADPAVLERVRMQAGRLLEMSRSEE